jgi:hypothetical protein
MRFVPSASGSEDAVQVAVPHVPVLAATPLPPRSLTQVMRAILRSSLADPASVTVALVVEYASDVVGVAIRRVGTARSRRSSASSRSAAFGSTDSDSVAPPQATRMTHAAATGASLRGKRR